MFGTGVHMSKRQRAWDLRRCGMVLACLLLAGSLQAQVSNLNKSTSYATVQAAVTAASDGDALLIYSNLWTESSITLQAGKRIMIRGLGMTNTILQAATSRGAVNHSLFSAPAGAIWTIQDMTLRYASNNAQAGIVVNTSGNASTGVFLRCNITLNDGMNNNGYGRSGICYVDTAGTAIYVTNCIVSSNMMSGCCGFNLQQNASLEVHDSCFFGNHAVSQANAIAGGSCVYGNKNNNQSVLLVNSTFANNISDGNGGAINLGVANNLTQLVYNCTFYGNTAGTNCGGIYVTMVSAAGKVVMSSCLVASNASSGAAQDLQNNYGTLTVSNSFLGTPVNNNSGALSTNGNGNVNCGYSAASPLVQPLAYNGGLTPTLALTYGSPAMNAGANPYNLASDQRGAPYQRLAGAGVDIGAYEFGSGPTNLAYSTTNGWTATAPGAGTISYLPNGSAAPLTLTLNSLTTFSGTDGAWSTNGNVVAANLPAGLQVSAVRTNAGTNLVIWLSGTANPATTNASVTNLLIGFTDAAFNNGLTAGIASQISGAATNQAPPLSVTFLAQSANAGTLTFSSTNFYENISYNDGRIGNTNSITVSGGDISETLTAAISPGTDLLAVNPGTYAAISGVPSGLTPHLVMANNTTLSFYLSGQAGVHAAANSTDVVLTFSNTAFTSGLSPTNAVTTNGVVFYDPATQVTLAYAGNIFYESSANDGTISNSITVTLVSNLFVSTPGTYLSGSMVTFPNLPNNLTGRVLCVNSTNVAISLAGAAVSNSAVNDAAIEVDFLPAAFYNLANGVGVVNATNASMMLSFLNPTLNYSGTSFAGAWQNDGSISNSLMLTLTGGLLAGSNFENYAASGRVVPANVPVGLAASVVQQSSTQLVFSLSGNAAVHANIANLGLAFQNTAFQLVTAGNVTNAVRNDLSVTFTGTRWPTNFYVSANTGSDASGDGTSGNPWRTIAYAVASTNVAAGNNDVINLAAGVYNETNVVIAGKIITVQGAGAGQTVLQPCAGYPLTLLAQGKLTNGTQRMFGVGPNYFTVNNLTLQYGFATNNDVVSVLLAANGGQQIFMNNCTICSNVNASSNIYSADIYVATGAGAGLVMNSCTVFGNCFVGGVLGVIPPVISVPYISASNDVFTANDTPALSVLGPLTMTDCLFLQNTNRYANAGGAVVDLGSGNSNNITRCSFINNQSGANSGAYGNGGAFRCYSTECFVNCTFYGNTAMSAVGGALSIYSGATILYNCTICSNSAATGGGIYNLYGSQVHAYSTILANNQATNSPDYYGFATFVDSYCLIGNNTNVGGMGYAPAAGQPNANHSYVGTSAALLDPQIVAPAYNHAAIPTCALQPSSLAIRHGSNPLGLTMDERNLAKYPRTSQGFTDVGAYQYHVPQGFNMFFR